MPDDSDRESTGMYAYIATFIVTALLISNVIQKHRYKTSSPAADVSYGFLFMDTVDDVFTNLEKSIGQTHEQVDSKMFIQASKPVMKYFGCRKYQRLLNKTIRNLCYFVQRITLYISLLVLLILELIRILVLGLIIIANILYYVTLQLVITGGLSMPIRRMFYNAPTNPVVEIALTAVLTYGIGRYLLPTIVHFALHPTVKIMFFVVIAGLMLRYMSRIRLFSY